MANLRLRGQEVVVTITQDGAELATINNIQSFELEMLMETMSQGYLGGKTELKDDIFKGAKFSFEMHTDTPDYVTLSRAIINRAKRNTPDTVFTISGRFDYNGQTLTRTIPDAKFGSIPTTVGGRAEYKKVKFQGEVEDLDEDIS